MRVIYQCVKCGALTPPLDTDMQTIPMHCLTTMSIKEISDLPDLEGLDVPTVPVYTQEQVAAFLDRLPVIMDEMQHLTGERALGRDTALFQLQAAIAQVKDEMREPGKDHRKYLTLEDL